MYELPTLQTASNQVTTVTPSTHPIQASTTSASLASFRAPDRTATLSTPTPTARTPTIPAPVDDLPLTRLARSSAQSKGKTACASPHAVPAPNPSAPRGTATVRARTSTSSTPVVPLGGAPASTTVQERGRNSTSGTPAVPAPVESASHASNLVRNKMVSLKRPAIPVPSTSAPFRSFPINPLPRDPQSNISYSPRPVIAVPPPSYRSPYGPPASLPSFNNAIGLSTAIAPPPTTNPAPATLQQSQTFKRCDRCKSKKLKCVESKADERCVRCTNASTECVFSNSPIKTPSTKSQAQAKRQQSIPSKRSLPTRETR